MKLKVAMVQYDANEPNIDFNTKVAMKYIKEAKKSGAGIVLFPECFLTAYCCPDIVEGLLPLGELENDSEFIGWCNSAVTEEEEHAILYHNGLYGSLKYSIQGKETPLYMIIHFADMWASRVLEAKGEEDEI